MSHAEAVTLHPAAGATNTIVSFASGLRYADLDDEVRYYARRHLLDTVGVMIAGAPGDVATNAESDARVRARRQRHHSGAGPRASATTCSTPRSSAAPRHTASSSTTATASARRIAAAPSCPRRSASATSARSRGAQLIEAVVAGYEVAICLARACAPDLRQRGFHPTSAVGPFGTAVAVAQAARAFARSRSPTRSASRRAPPPGCSRS